jgi:hypothetical protein
MWLPQIVYQDDNASAAKELASALTQAQSAPIYVPNFGQVQVSGITQLDSPVVPQITRWVLTLFKADAR